MFSFKLNNFNIVLIILLLLVIAILFVVRSSPLDNDYEKILKVNKISTFFLGQSRFIMNDYFILFGDHYFKH